VQKEAKGNSTMFSVHVIQGQKSIEGKGEEEEKGAGNNFQKVSWSKKKRTR